MSFKVIAVVDKVGTALDRLAKGVAPYMRGIDYHVVDVHPKRPSIEQLYRFESLAREADVIDAQYYRTIEMLRQRYEWLKEIPTILTHNNPYSIHESDWNGYQVNVGNNREIYENLKNITESRIEMIRLAVDPYFWEFNPDYTYDRSVIMVANRIESKKGILPVALACKEIRAQMYLVGAISDPEYWKEVMETGVVTFAQEVSDEDLRSLYHKAGIHVCNSIDNFESGTLPILEAIFCGVPVLSRPVGHVPEFQESVTLLNSHPEDVDQISTVLNEMFMDKKKLNDMRQEAWFAIKDRNYERRAYSYRKLYRELTTELPVSVIVPVADKPQTTAKNINALLSQTYKNIEIIIMDDGQEDQADLVSQLSMTSTIPIIYSRMKQPGYNLAKARNIAAIHATSDILVF